MEDASHSSLPDMESCVDPQVNTILRCLAPEEIDMLRDAFIFMDRDSDGFVSMEEMLLKVRLSVPEERFPPLREYLTPLFLVADKDGDGKLSLTEFLMSFADGPGVVPAEVVNNCVAAVRVRLTDEEISALQENFRAMDTNGDGYLDAVELEAALRTHLTPKFPDLADEQYKEILAVILASADADDDGRLCLSEFIRSFQEDQGVLPASFVDTGLRSKDAAGVPIPATRELTEVEADVLREAFAVLDKNDDGYIDFVDLYNALWESLSGQVEDKTQIKDLCDLIMATADRRNSGRLSLSEFILGFLRNMEVMQIPVAVAQEKVRSACNRLQQMHESGELERLVTVFEDLDRNCDGYLDRAEMVAVLSSLFKDAFPEWDEQMLNSVMSAIVTGAETHSSGRISLEEFIRSFVDGPGILPPEAVRVLDSRATAARQEHHQQQQEQSQQHNSELRPRTASDDDLNRISEALRRLNETADNEGCVTMVNLRAAIGVAFEDQQESHPGKADAMYEYVLSRFVNVMDAGRLAWNENVQIEDEEEEEEESQAEVPMASAAPIPVPQAEEQELHHAPVAVAWEKETGSPCDAAAAEQERNAALAEPQAAEAEGEEEEEEKRTERPMSNSFGRRRRIVRADSIDMLPVTKSTGSVGEYLLATGEDSDSEWEEGEQTGDGASGAVRKLDAKGSAAGAVCEHFDRERAIDTLATMPAIVEKATQPALLSSGKPAKGSSAKKSATNGALVSYRCGGMLRTGDHNTGSIFEEELRMLFKKYDTDKLGYLDRNQFKKVYCSMEQYGLEPSQTEINRQFTKYAYGSNKIFFDEFCVLMLQRVQM